jgi:hypothetical protein
MPTPSLTRAQFEVRREKFERWLHERGAELLTPTNEWELLRFKTEKGTGIVYTNKRGVLTWMGPAAEAFFAYVSMGSTWRAVPKEQRRRRSSVACQALRDRDGDDCFFCHLPVAIEDESVEHLVNVTHGGPDHIVNMAMAHRACNHEAGNISLMEKIRMREANLVRLYTPGTLPNLLIEPEVTAAAQALEREMIDDLFDRSDWPPAADETTPPWKES